MKKFLLPLLLISSFFATAQKKNSVPYFAATISADDMKRHLYIIAGPEMEGHDTPSPGLEKAANYIEDHFKTLGLLPGNKDSYRQLYPIYKDSMTNTRLIINGTAFEMNKDFQPNVMINHTAEMRFSECAFAGYGIVDGEIDRIETGERQEPHRQRGRPQHPFFALRGECHGAPQRFAFFDMMRIWI